MKTTDKEVLYRMCNKIKLSDMQKEDIMQRINEEVSGKKHKKFNVRRFATVAACIIGVVAATSFAQAKLDIVGKISKVYTAWHEEKGELNEVEEAIVEELSLDVGCEFEIEGGRIRIDGIMYDSSQIYLTYTAMSDDGDPATAAEFLKHEIGVPSNGLEFFIKDKLSILGGWTTRSKDIDPAQEGYQGCFILRVSPIQNLTYDKSSRVNNFGFSQGDEIVLTDRKYYEYRGLVDSLDDIEKIYGTFTLAKPINDLKFTCENTEGMEILETVTEIRLSPLSITVMGDELLRKTYPEGIGYTYRVNGDRVYKIGTTGIPGAEETRGGYVVTVVKKDGSVAETAGTHQGSTEGGEQEYFYAQKNFIKPLDLAEVDYILVQGWGLEYKILVNAE